MPTKVGIQRLQWFRIGISKLVVFDEIDGKVTGFRIESGMTNKDWKPILR